MDRAASRGRCLRAAGDGLKSVKRSVGPVERALDEKSWGKRTKNEGQRGGKTRREKKKSSGAPACPRIRDNQQREEGKQRALGKEKAAVTRLERVKRKKTNLGFSDFRNYALECRNVGMAGQRKRERERERDGDPETVGRAS
jgi:hypothetical protein